MGDRQDTNVVYWNSIDFPNINSSESKEEE